MFINVFWLSELLFEGEERLVPVRTTLYRWCSRWRARNPNLFIHVQLSDPRLNAESKGPCCATEHRGPACILSQIHWNSPDRNLTLAATARDKGGASKIRMRAGELLWVQETHSVQLGDLEGRETEPEGSLS